VANSYDKTYKIVYQSTAGATIVFEGHQLYGGAGQGAAAAAPTTAPKRGRGLFQRLFAGAKAAPAATTSAGSTSSEAEGQAASAIMADSALIGPVRFVPAGPCLQGTADSSKGQLHGLRVTVSGCNFENPDPLIAAYKNVHRV
jgi:hypothetical protein